MRSLLLNEALNIMYLISNPYSYITSGTDVDEMEVCWQSLCIKVQLKFVEDKIKSEVNLVGQCTNYLLA
jgi:hypothetical protein